MWLNHFLYLQCPLKIRAPHIFSLISFIPIEFLSERKELVKLFSKLSFIMVQSQNYGAPSENQNH